MMERTNHSEIPSKYTQLGVSHGFEPKDVNDLRLFLVGPFGSGKTTFIGSRERNLILSSEKSAEFLQKPKSDQMPVRNYKEFEAIMKVLESDKNNKDRPYDCVTLDPIDMFLSYFDEHLCTKYGGKTKLETIMDYGMGGKGVSILRGFLEEQITKLEEWGYSWMITSFVTERMQKTADGGEYVAPRISLYPSLKDSICRKADYVLVSTTSSKPSTVEVEEPILDADGKQRMRNGVPMMRKSVKSIRLTDYLLDVTPGRIPDTKLRIAIPENLLLTYGDGWSIFKEKYNGEVARIKQENKET